MFVPVLERAAAELSHGLAAIPGVRVEHKRFAVAVHYREVAPERVGEIVAAAHQLGARDGLRVTSGRMLVELRPDLDWDKGTTLAWIRDRIDPSGALLPIYIGDDLTDEDAFDAVTFDGIGIVVGHDEDGDRKTAAHFTLAESRSGARVHRSADRSGWPTSIRCRARHGTTSSTDTTRRARSFVRRCARWETATSPPGAPRRSRRPGRCTTRAPTPPGCTTASSTTSSGTEIDNESLVNLPNWLALTFRIDGGSWFDIDAVTCCPTGRRSIFAARC